MTFRHATCSIALLATACFNPSSGGGGGASFDGGGDVGVTFDASKAEAGDGATPALRWSIEPIIANFMQATYSTEYMVVIKGDVQGMTALTLPKAMTVSWSLSLELVDPSGAPDPTNPGSGAAVDVGCNNAGVGIPNPQVDNLTPGGSSAYQTNDVFSWFHPDAANSTPPGKYACNHMDEGPSGHQGLITVVVSDGVWKCTESYKGSNTSTATSVSSGMASMPVCKAM